MSYRTSAMTPPNTNLEYNRIYVSPVYKSVCCMFMSGPCAYLRSVAAESSRCHFCMKMFFVYVSKSRTLRVCSNVSLRSVGRWECVEWIYTACQEVIVSGVCVSACLSESRAFSSTQPQTSVDTVTTMEFLSLVPDLKKIHIWHLKLKQKVWISKPHCGVCLSLRDYSESQQEHRSWRSWRLPWTVQHHSWKSSILTPMLLLVRLYMTQSICL